MSPAMSCGLYFSPITTSRLRRKRHLDLMFVIRFGHQDAPYEGTQGFREAKGLAVGFSPFRWDHWIEGVVMKYDYYLVYILVYQHNFLYDYRIIPKVITHNL